jgi:predicted secreted protein
VIVASSKLKDWAPRHAVSDEAADSAVPVESGQRAAVVRYALNSAIGTGWAKR